VEQEADNPDSCVIDGNVSMRSPKATNSLTIEAQNQSQLKIAKVEESETVVVRDTRNVATQLCDTFAFQANIRYCHTNGN
jgi:hypothetical protein